jgi:hypothetical protein
MMWLFVDREKENFKKWLKVECPECVNCSFLEVKDYSKMTCRCFYRFKNKCVLKK